MFNLDRRQAMTQVVMGIVTGPSIAADDTAKAFELLRVGDDEPRALALIQRKPDRSAPPCWGRRRLCLNSMTALPSTS
jgi:hypothetical protein